MSNTGSEPTRCPCGFWGSPQTRNLCSKCYKDELRRSEKIEDTKAAFAATTTSLASVTCVEASSHEEGNTEADGEEKGSAETSTSDNKTPEDRPIQKNKKRCWTCKSRLELAQRQLGICRCEYVFCQLHRLPELHSCTFDHKESGRKEARQKMVSPGPRKVGRSFQRMDE